MAIARMIVELRIPHARSLKDRRQVVRALKDRLRHGFNISVAELDEAVLWQSATIGIVAISAARNYLRGEMEIVELAINRMTAELGAEIEDCWWEFVESDETEEPPEIDS